VKLEGSLDAFGLPDIFQLLSYTKKTGGLHLTQGAVDGVVYFAAGAVTGATADRTRLTLARRLVGQGLLTHESVAAAAERARTDETGLVRALVEAGAVDADLVRGLAAEEVTRSVAVLLTWESGDFSFSVDEPDPDDVGVALTTDGVVAAARETAPGSEAPADGPVSRADQVLALVPRVEGPVELSPEAWALLTLVDGRRDVAGLADLTGTDVPSLASRLSDLVARGVLQEASEGGDAATVLGRQLDLVVALEGGSGPGAGEASSSTAAAATPSTVSSPAAVPQAPTTAAGAVPTATPVPVASTAPAAPVAAPVASAAPDRPAAPAAPLAEVPAAPSTPSVPSTQGSSPFTTPAPVTRPQPAERVTTVGGPHVPGDVVPPRPEPFLASRQPEHPEDLPDAEESDDGGVDLGDDAPVLEVTRQTPVPPPAPVAAVAPVAPVASVAPVGPMAAVAGTGLSAVGEVHGSVAMAPDPKAAAIERDPSVNRSLLLRLIAGVRGL
jgi:hypothetical protein